MGCTFCRSSRVCKPESEVCARQRLVFVSSESYTTNLGGLEGADAKCQVLAASAGWGHLSFKAWIGLNGSSLSERFEQSIFPYVLINGVKVADNWTQLTHAQSSNTQLYAPINLTEKGELPAVVDFGDPTTIVRTNIVADHSTLAFRVLEDFGNWTNTNDVDWGYFGDWTSTRYWSHWVARPAPGNYSSSRAPIYCMQQGD